MVGVCDLLGAVRFFINRGAGDEIRTHDNHVGNVVLYQLSYARAVLFMETTALQKWFALWNYTP